MEMMSRWEHQVKVVELMRGVAGWRVKRKPHQRREPHVKTAAPIISMDGPHTGAGRRAPARVAAAVQLLFTPLSYFPAAPRCGFP